MLSAQGTRRKRTTQKSYAAAVKVSIRAGCFAMLCTSTVRSSSSCTEMLHPWMT